MVARSGAQCAEVVDPDDDERLHTNPAAGFLGISRSTLIRLTNRGEIGVYRVGGRNQYSVRELRSYLASCKQPAVNA
jgi:excisionase family DNA binding protein